MLAYGYEGFCIRLRSHFWEFAFKKYALGNVKFGDAHRNMSLVFDK